MAYFTRINATTRMIEQSLHWFPGTGSPETFDVPVSEGSPIEFEWLPDTPPTPTNYQEVERVEPVPEGATEIEYNIIPIPLPGAKYIKKNEIDQLRALKAQEPVTYDGHIYQCDGQSRFNLTATLSAVQAGVPLPANFVWRTEDDQNVVHDAASLTALAAVMLEQVNVCYNEAWAHKDAVEALTTVEEVEAYVYSGGWTVV